MKIHCKGFEYKIMKLKLNNPTATIKISLFCSNLIILVKLSAAHHIKIEFDILLF